MIDVSALLNDILQLCRNLLEITKGLRFIQAVQLFILINHLAYLFFLHHRAKVLEREIERIKGRLYALENQHSDDLK